MALLQTIRHEYYRHSETEVFPLLRDRGSPLPSQLPGLRKVEPLGELGTVAMGQYA